MIQDQVAYRSCVEKARVLAVIRGAVKMHTHRDILGLAGPDLRFHFDKIIAPCSMAEENWDKHRAVDVNGAQLSGGSASKMLLGPRQAAHPAAAATPLETSIRIASSARAGARQKTCSSPPRRIGRNFEAVERQPASIGAYVIPDARYQNTKRHCSPLARLLHCFMQQLYLYMQRSRDSQVNFTDLNDLTHATIPTFHRIFLSSSNYRYRGSQRQRFRETVACLSPGDPTQTPSTQPLYSTSHSVGAPPANFNIASFVRPTNLTSPVFLQTQIRSFRWGRKSPEVSLLTVSNLPSR